MGWVAGNNDDKNKDPFPVDTLVNDILKELKKTDGACTEHSGQNWFCCNGMATCLVKFKNDMGNVLSHDVDAQNMHRACRKTRVAYGIAANCVSKVWCHENADREEILSKFNNAMAGAKAKERKHCNNLSPERTTTQRPSTTATEMPTTTTQKPRPTTSTTAGTITPPTKQPIRTTTKITTPSSVTVEIPKTTTQTSTTTATTTTTKTSPTRSPTDSQTPSSSSKPTVPSSTQSVPISTKHVNSSPGTQTNSPTTDKTDPTEENHEDTTYTDRLNTTTVQEKTTSFKGNADTSTPLLPEGSTTVSGPGAGNGSLSGNNTVTSHPENWDAVIVVGAIIGGLLLMLAFVIFVIIKWRTYKKEQEGSNGSVSSRKPFLWNWFHSSKTETNTGDTEIYAEIDEAFMDAVYKVDQDKSNKRKSRSSSNSQVNICYEAGFEDSDAIVSAANAARLRRTKPAPGERIKDEFPKQVSTDNPPKETKSQMPDKNVQGHNFPNDFELIRKKDLITSFQNEEYNKGRMRADISRDAKGYMLSRPAFTDIGHEGNTYEDIPASGGEYVEINEPIYEVPMRDNQTYDTAYFGGVRENRQLPEPNYNHIHVYKNDNTDIPYKYSDDDDAFYENDDTMMEY